MARYSTIRYGFGQHRSVVVLSGLLILAGIVAFVAAANVTGRAQAQTQTQGAAQDAAQQQAAQPAQCSRAKLLGIFNELAPFAHGAVSADPAVSGPAIERLRAAGPDGLEAMFIEHRQAIETLRGPLMAIDIEGKPELLRLKAALEAVSRQYDGHASCLYWYTDLEAAKTAAAESGKPILSLRLLGNLDEECSCANSRFFRTALYANTEVAAYLRNNFVLHWKSVRPVPQITIDFGDGRVMKRTITGNSIHYVLATDGTIIDALPGLYGPQAFLQNLQRDVDVAKSIGPLNPQERNNYLVAFHMERAHAIAASLQADINQLSMSETADDLAQSAAAAEREQFDANRPNAAAANNRTIGKRMMETKLLTAMSLMEADIARSNALVTGVTDEMWQRIAELHAEDSRLDDSSRALMREHQPDAIRANLLTVSKARVEDPMVRIIASFERSVAEDTVRNEYTFHRQIHEWLASAPTATPDVEDLNSRVYAQLFLTPDSDPWLGLISGEYSALHADGLVPVPPTVDNGQNEDGKSGEARTRNNENGR